MPPVDVLAKTVTFLTDDSVHLRGSYYEARDDDSLSLVLVHDEGAQRGWWEPYVPLFRSRGWSVLTFDLRGHGESLRQDMRSALLAPEPAHRTSQHAYPADLRAAVAFVARQAKADPRRIAALGIGLGADLAYAGSARGWGAASTVCVGLDESRARMLAGTGTFAPRSVYLMYAEGDPVASATATAFAATAISPAEAKGYPGNADGPALWTERQPEILARAIAWIERTI